MASETSSSSQADSSEKMEVLKKATELLAQGKRNMVCGEVPKAVTLFEEAVKMLAANCGELSRDCADAYLNLGSALLELGRMESSVLGAALEGVEAEDEKEEEGSEQFEKPPPDDAEERIKLREQVYAAMSEEVRKKPDEKDDQKSEAHVANGRADNDENEKKDEMETDEIEDNLEGKSEPSSKEEKNKEVKDPEKEDKNSLENAKLEEIPDSKDCEGLPINKDTVSDGNNDTMEKGEKMEADKNISDFDKEKQDKSEAKENDSVEGVDTKMDEVKELDETMPKSSKNSNENFGDEGKHEDKMEDEAKGPDQKEPQESKQEGDVAMESKENENVEDNEEKTSQNDEKKVLEEKCQNIADNDVKDKTVEMGNTEEKGAEESNSAAKASSLVTEEPSVADSELDSEKASGCEDMETDKDEKADEGNEDEDMAEGENDEETADDDEGEASQDEEHRGDHLGNFHLAWEYLDLAKFIYLKGETKEDQLKAAESHVKLGEVSMETEQHETAAEDLESALKIQQKHLEKDDRMIAETHYTLGLAYGLGKDFKNSIQHYQSAVSVIEARIASMTKFVEESEVNAENKENNEEDALKKHKEEIKDLRELIPDIKEKIEDAKIELEDMAKMKEIAKEALGLGTSKSVGFSSSSSSKTEEAETLSNTEKTEENGEKKASDISSLIRKKRKQEEDGVTEIEAKKVCKDAASGDAPTEVSSEKMNGHSEMTEVSS